MVSWALASSQHILEAGHTLGQSCSGSSVYPFNMGAKTHLLTATYTLIYRSYIGYVRAHLVPLKDHVEGYVIIAGTTRGHQFCALPSKLNVMIRHGRGIEPNERVDQLHLCRRVHAGQVLSPFRHRSPSHVTTPTQVEFLTGAWQDHRGPLFSFTTITRYSSRGFTFVNPPLFATQTVTKLSTCHQPYRLPLRGIPSTFFIRPTSPVNKEADSTGISTCQLASELIYSTPF